MRLNKKDNLRIGVKNFLTLQGFRGKQQVEVVNYYISTCDDYKRENYPKARNDEEAMLAFIIAGFPRFAQWLNEMVSEAH